MVDRKYKKSQRSMIESQKGGNQDKDRKDLQSNGSAINLADSFLSPRIEKSSEFANFFDQ